MKPDYQKLWDESPIKDEIFSLLGNENNAFEVFAAGVDSVSKRHEAIIAYCRPHISHMWAAAVVGLLLDVDFRDSEKAIKELE